MTRNLALLAVMLIATPVVAVAQPPNPMATPIPHVEVAPGILLGTPKPVACLGAQSMDFLLSSCSGAPGTQLTLKLGTAVTPAAVLFTQSAPSKGNYTAQVGRSAGAYMLTVPSLCNGGNPSFSLAFTFERGSTHLSQGLGTFNAICPQTLAVAGNCGSNANAVTEPASVLHVEHRGDGVCRRAQADPR